MKTVAINTRSALASVLFDVVAIATIFLLPPLSHLTGIALYKLDPMRIVLFAAIVLTHQRNAYLIALLLPLVSFMISSHPHFYKVFLIATELLTNVWLFYVFAGRIRNTFIATIASIVVSKIAYYLLKLSLIELLLIDDRLVGTPLLIQAVVSIAISLLMVISPKKGTY
jgi:hypothetical protein